MIWAAGAGSLILLILVVAGLWDLIRNRHTMEGWQVALWAVLIVLAPVIGLVAYLFWRLFRTEAMRDAIGFQQEQDGMRRPQDEIPPSSYT
ncbi:MAG: PLD nuclease N-terminal domain-containing protein [Acidimicrobiia bacterium]